MQQHHEIGLAFGQTEAGYQPGRLLALFRATDRLLVRARLGRELELAEPLAEAAQVRAPLAGAHFAPFYEVVVHAAQRALEDRATIGQH